MCKYSGAHQINHRENDYERVLNFMEQMRIYERYEAEYNMLSEIYSSFVRII